MFQPCLKGLILTTLVCPLLAGCEANRTTQVQDEIREIFGGDLPNNCQVRKNPVSSLGVGTMWAKEKKNTSPLAAEEGWLIGSPKSWFNDDVNSADRASILNKIIQVGEMGGTGSSQSNAKTLAGAVEPPDIYKILNVGGNFETKDEIVRNLAATNVLRRDMNWRQFTREIEKGTIQKDISDDVKKGNFYIVNRDIVIEGYKATVSVKENDKAGLHAKLSQAVGKVIGEGGKLELEVSKNSDGSFAVQAKEPVVAITCFKEPPPSRSLGEPSIKDIPDVKTWDPVSPTQLPKELGEIISR
jgi:hypothetical protein